MNNNIATTMFVRLMKRLTGVLLLMVAVSTAQAQQIRFEPEGFNTGVGDGRMWADYNNDGKDDFCKLLGSDRETLQCYPSTGDGFGSPFTVPIDRAYRNAPFAWADIDGDGRVDFCRLLDVIGSYYPVTGRVSCRLGGGFTSAVITTLPIEWHTGTEESQQMPGLSDPQDLFYVDLDADGRTDICYFYYDHTVSANGGDLRCRLSIGTGFASDSSAWTRFFADKGPREWPRGFFDFNGDGFPDYCMVRRDGRLSCTLGGPNGFSSSEILSNPLGDPSDGKGAAFLDTNGDGKTDFCWVGGYSGPRNLKCVVSNGRGWEPVIRESPTYLDAGHANWRWWADINGDGYPDFCRAVGWEPDGGHDGFYDDYSTMSCRLNLGGGDDTGAPAFAYADLVQETNFGRAEGGRAFCDPNGTGIQTFCRTTFRRQEEGELCYDNERNTECMPAYVNKHGLFTGFSNTVQAQQPLLNAFSDGLGAETRVTYLPMTNSLVYKRSGFGTYPRELITQPKSAVVFETRAWQRTANQDWLPLTGTARYFYKDSLYDTKIGSLGFRERWMLNEGNNTMEHFVFFQGRGPAVDASSRQYDMREVGHVKMHERYAIAGHRIQPPAEPGLNTRQRFLKEAMAKATSLAQVPASGPTNDSPFILLQRTTNTLGATLATSGGTGTTAVADNARFRPIVSSATETWDWNGGALVAMPRTEAVTDIDSLGNVLRAVQTTTYNAGTGQGEKRWQKTTTNVYDDNRSTWLLGRLTRATVVSTAPSAADQIGVYPRNAGSSSGASQTSGTAPAVPQPGVISPAALSAILQLLLD